MRTLIEALEDARERGVAVGHFNISDSTQFNAILEAACLVVGPVSAGTTTKPVPVIIGVSEGEEEFIGIHNAVALVRVARELGKEVYLNADHHRSVESCKRAIDAGFDSVIFDGVTLPLEENIAKTREVVEYARKTEAHRQAQGDQNASILVEAELGYIGTSSKMLDDVPDDVLLDSLPTPNDAKEFVDATGVDALAPAVGNLHGMLKGVHNPRLQIDLIKSLREVLPDTHFVLHGGSGIRDEDFVRAIKAGMNCIHINTEIRKAYRDGIETALQNDNEQIAPYKYMNHGRDAMREIVKDRLNLFTSLI